MSNAKRTIETAFLHNIGRSAFKAGQGVDEIVEVIEGQGGNFEDQAEAVRAFFTAKLEAEAQA